MLKDTVDIVIPMPDVTYTAFVVQTLLPLLQEPMVRTVLLKPGMRSEYAREMLLDEWYKNGAEWVFITDHDMILPPRTLPRLLSYRKKMITGLYFGRGEKKYPVIFEPTALDVWPLTRYFQYPRAGLFEVGACGHGCLLIHRTVFDKMSKPWSQLGPYAGLPVVGSDVRLCHKARSEAGVKIWCDPTVKCGHLAPMPITEQDWLKDQDTYQDEWNRYLDNKKGQS